MQKLYQGVVNHVWFPLTDATDFASIESGIADSSIKVSLFGFLKGNSAVASLTADGTGSLAASGRDFYTIKSGVFGIIVGPAELSDTQNAFYDRYLLWASCTGAALQLIELEGEYKDTSDLYSLVSDMNSTMGSQFAVTSNYLSSISAMVSDVDSQLTVTHDLLSDVESALDSQFAVVSNHLSSLSDAASNLLSRVPKEVSSKSLLSDVHSDLKSAVGNVSVTLTASDISDIASAVAAAIGDKSDIASAVWSEKYNTYSAVASTFGSFVTQQIQGASNMLSSISALVSDVDSGLVSQISALLSDIGSMLDVEFGSLSSEVGSQYSDLSSKIGGVSASAIANKVWSDFGSKVGVSISQFVSNTSNYLSNISALVSDVDSQLTVTHALVSDVESQLDVTHDLVSDVDSALTSQFNAVSNYLSNISAMVSDVDSQLTVTHDLVSDVESQLDATHDLLSDVESAVDAFLGSTGEPGQGAPPATTDRGTKIDYLYKAWRNRHTQTSSEYALYADDGSTKDQEATVSDDGTTFVRGEIGTGA